MDEFVQKWTLIVRGGPCLDTVRALHQTVVALRTALEESKNEILELKAKAWPIDSVGDALRALSIENHVLRQQLLNLSERKQLVEESIDEKHAEITIKQPQIEPQLVEEKKSKKQVVVISPKRQLEARIFIKTETISPRKISRSLESLTILKSPTYVGRSLTVSKTVSFSNLSRECSFVEDDPNSMDDRIEEENSPQSPEANDLDQNEEVDDIELIFTTDDTREADFKEQLVSIDAGDSATEQAHLLQCPLSEIDQNLDVSDRELEDDVFNDNFENENQENSNFQSFEIRRESSQQIYNSKSDNSINHEENKSFKSYYSYQDSSFENKSMEKDESFDRFDDKIRIVETDISKCGIQDVEYIGSRRNTCPNPLQYRPLMHREAMAKGFVGKKSRPILTHSNAIRKESGAQTDISALPGSSWLSESSLANKARIGENFPTLPSKFPMPGSRVRLSEKTTVEARRVLLSDIGFTSMVPELSRSADHLFPANLKPPIVTTYGQFLRTTDLYSPGCQSQKFTWTTTTATPSDGSQTHSRYSSMYPLPSPLAPPRRCSAPVSPSRRTILKPTSSKVRFANGSLPELHATDWNVTMDSGDSTDSLVEEAENYLRRSIDCIMTRSEVPVYSEKKSVPRRASAPDSNGDNVPPSGWQPFLPRISRDLKPDHWVKVITPEGRVRGGRVRYVGPVCGQTEQFVGVQLGSPEGHSDGTYNNRRYFQCEPYHGIFVPFKKVIMGWRP